MKKTIFYLLSVIVLMTGCVKPEVTTSFMRKVVINAGFETDTKAAVSETGKFSWQADDCISIMATDGNFYTFTLKSGAGDKYAMFEGELPTDVNATDVAVYPAVDALSSVVYDKTNASLAYTLPSEYTYQEGKSNTPMVAVFEEASEHLAFKHIGALVRFHMKSMPANSKLVVTAKDQTLSGSYSIDLTKVGTTEGAMISKEASGSNSSITVVYNVTDSNSDAVIDVPIPTGIYDALTVEVIDEDNDVIYARTLSTNGQPINRSHFITVTPADLDSWIRDIQSVSFVPFYEDGKAVMINTYKDYTFADLTFSVTPVSAAAEIEAKWSQAISFIAQSQTADYELQVLSYAVDKQTGTISVTLSGKNLSDDFYNNLEELEVSMSVSDGIKTITSDAVYMHSPKRIIHNSERNPKVVAHRGYWDVDGSAQNSIAALLNADAIAVWGCEVDVWETSDNVLVVNHDATINGVTIQTSPYSSIKDFTLSNGETLPTFEQYLEVFKTQCKNVVLIIEIKTHATSSKTISATRAAINMVHEKGIDDKVEYIAFSPDACDAVVKYAPSARVAYLESNMTPLQCVQRGYTGVDYHYSSYQSNPTWITDAHNLGLDVNVWTLNYLDIVRTMKNSGVDIITTDAPHKVPGWIY